MSKFDLGVVSRAAAITGSIGSGKSKVAQWLAHEWSLPLYNCDEEVKFLLTPGQPGWSCLREFLDPSYFDSDSRLIKSKLRQAIFVDAELRQVIEHSLHPLVLARLKAKTHQFTRSCLVEVPLLYEANWQGFFAKVLVVYADSMTCIKRVMDRDGVTAAQALAVLHSQWPIQEKITLADFAIDNSGAWVETISQLETIKKTGLFFLNKKKLDTLCS